VFIKYEAEVSSRVGGGERGVVDFGKLFTETNEQKFNSTQRHSICTISFFLSPAAKDIPVSSILP